MKPKLLASSGTFAEVCWHQNQWHAVWREGTHALRFATFAADLSEQTFGNVWPIGEDAAGFPRFLSWDGVLWLAFKAGAPAYDIVLQKLDMVALPVHLGTGFGNDPVVLGEGFLAWQATADYQVHFAILGWPGDLFVRMGAPTGLSRIVAGRVVLIDEDRTAIPGYTRPCWAGDAVAVEGDGPHGPFGLVRRSDGLEVRLFEGQNCYAPRLATDGQGRYAYVTFGEEGEGVRLALIEPSDFRASTPPPPPVPPPDPPVPPKPPTPPETPTMSVTVQDYLRSGATAASGQGEDFDRQFLERFRQGVWQRDQGEDVPSRGALSYYHRALLNNFVKRVNERGHALDGADDWGRVYELACQDGLAQYRAQNKPGVEDPQ